MILNELFLIAMGVNTIFFFAGVYITGMHILMHRRKTFDIDAKPGKLYNWNVIPKKVDWSRIRPPV